MGLNINTNIAALTARNRLNETNMRMGKTLERLSSGLRINRAADDAAGLAVSEKMRAQIKGLTQASRNSQDAISMIQTGEGALNEVHSMLQRMRELAVQASNDTLSTSDRGAINTELQQLKAEVNNISQTTKFNGKQLLSGSLLTTQDPTSTALEGNVLATTDNATITKIDVSSAKANETYTFSAGTGTNDIVLTRASDNVSQTLTLNPVGANGAATLDFSQLGVKLTLSADSTGKAAADIVTDLAAKTVKTLASSGSANFQTGAYASDFINVAFTRMDISASGMSALDAALTAFNGTQNVANAQGLITAVDSGIDMVNQNRANLGAVQNRLEHTINSLSVSIENLSSSESRIRDADVAQETSNMVTAQILTQAGTSVLAQANQAPQAALSLLKG